MKPKVLEDIIVKITYLLSCGNKRLAELRNRVAMFSLDVRYSLGLLLAGSLLALAGCTTTGPSAPAGGNKSGAGWNASSTTQLSVLDELGNGLLGNAARQLRPADRQKALEAEYKALEYANAGKPVNWQSSTGSASGEVVAATPYQVGSQNCRQYTHSYTIAGAPQTSRGTACRNADGSWTPLV